MEIGYHGQGPMQGVFVPKRRSAGLRLGAMRREPDKPRRTRTRGILKRCSKNGFSPAIGRSGPKKMSTKEKVVCVKDITHDEWLALRRTGIGGSDAATVVGLNPYSSPYYLFCDKRGELAEKEDTEAMRQGRDLEQYVADRWMERTGKKCKRNNYMWRSTKWPFMLADIDREVVGENAGLECKTTSVYNNNDFENGNIQDSYYVQCQHYMAVMGYDRMYLAVLVLNKGFYTYVIERDEEDISHLAQGPKATSGTHCKVDKLRILWAQTQTSRRFRKNIRKGQKAFA